MLSVPGRRRARLLVLRRLVRVYVLFEDGTDLYWARSRVLEYLNQVQAACRAGAKPRSGPDATGVGWIYQYALVDRSGRTTGATARAAGLVPRFELKTVPTWPRSPASAAWCASTRSCSTRTPGAPTASPHEQVIERDAAGQPGGRRLGARAGEAEYMVRAGCLQSLDDFRKIPLVHGGGVSVRLGDVARIRSARRCAAASPNSTAKAKWPAAWS